MSCVPALWHWSQRNKCSVAGPPACLPALASCTTLQMPARLPGELNKPNTLLAWRTCAPHKNTFSEEHNASNIRTSLEILWQQKHSKKTRKVTKKKTNGRSTDLLLHTQKKQYPCVLVLMEIVRRGTGLWADLRIFSSRKITVVLSH